MNTGHDGSMTTIHANDTRDAISRMEMMIGMSGFDLPIWIIRRQIASAVQIVVFWGLFLGVIPAIIVFFEQRWNLHLEFPAAVRWGGGILFVAAGALGLWSAYTMSTRGEGTPLPSAMARRLVVTGPYLFVRNPMAIAGIAQGVSVGLLAGSWLVVVYALSGSLIWNWIVRPLEEEDLEARFGAAYTSYARAVRCWIPQLRPFRAEREQSVTLR